MLILEREGNRNTQRKILIAQERSAIDAQLAHERTAPDLVSVVRGTMHYRGRQFSSDRTVADFSRGSPRNFDKSLEAKNLLSTFSTSAAARQHFLLLL